MVIQNMPNFSAHNLLTKCLQDLLRMLQRNKQLPAFWLSVWWALFGSSHTLVFPVRDYSPYKLICRYFKVPVSPCGQVAIDHFLRAWLHLDKVINSLWTAMLCDPGLGWQQSISNLVRMAKGSLPSFAGLDIPKKGCSFGNLLALEIGGVPMHDYQSHSQIYRRGGGSLV